MSEFVLPAGYELEEGEPGDRVRLLRGGELAAVFHYQRGWYSPVDGHTRHGWYWVDARGAVMSGNHPDFEGVLGSALRWLEQHGVAGVPPAPPGPDEEEGPGCR